jgi:hypothetical protein
MVKRLQVLLEEDELRTIQATARRHRLTTAAWVRRSLRESIEREPRPDARAKLQTVRNASGHAFPVGEIDDILADIERGYADDHA